MGIIIGKLRRKKTSYEVLETLDKEIQSIEDYRRSTEEHQQKIVGRFVIYSVGAYLLVAFIFYFYYFPINAYDRLLCLISFMLVPVAIFFIRSFLTWYYKRKISRKQNKLTNLREQKKKILETVMETETYKVAKTILDKFAVEPVIRKATIAQTELATPVKSVIPRAPVSAITGGLRQRSFPPINQPLMLPPTTPVRSILQQSPTAIGRSNQLDSAVITRTPFPMPRSILPRERSVFDKMVDYLVGDGPSNRYALICNSCFSHNGMAFKEEFEYISFNCCYCYAFNPARKKQPTAPKLELKPLQAPSSSDTSDSEKHSPDDSDNENETVLNISQEKVNGVPEDLEKSETTAVIQKLEATKDVQESETTKVVQESETKKEVQESEITKDIQESETEDIQKDIVPTKVESTSKMEVVEQPEDNNGTDLKIEDIAVKPEQIKD